MVRTEYVYMELVSGTGANEQWYERNESIFIN